MLSVLVMISSCSLIDDDLSVCGTDVKIVYFTRPQNNIADEIATVLPEQTVQPVADSLRAFLEPVFTPQIHDLHLSFYTSPEDKEYIRTREQVNATQKDYIYYMPKGDYVHPVVANSDGNGVVLYRGGQSWYNEQLRQTADDTVASFETGVYTARPMLKISDTEQTVQVPLYMTCSAVALVIDSATVGKDSIRACVKGMASGFDIADSVYLYMPQAVNAMRCIADLCFATVCFPSADVPDSEGTYYTVVVHVTNPDGTVTETLLTMHRPLNADRLKIIRCKLKDDGEVEPQKNNEVGVSVTLDWKKGGDFEINE